MAESVGKQQSGKQSAGKQQTAKPKAAKTKTAVPETAAVDFAADSNNYVNRELSWLEFNYRVLSEARDKNLPLFERLKFLSITSSNLDEFFMVRVGSLLDLSIVSPDEIDNKSGLDPAEQLQAIYEAIPSLLEIKGQLYSRVSSLLAQAGVQDLTYDDLTAEEQAQVDDDFRAVVLPVLSPQIVGQRQPSLRLDNKALYITALLRSKSGKAALGFVPCPASLPPIFLLPESRGRFLRLETIVCHWTPILFKKYTVEELCVISATRNADLSFDREKFEDSDRDFRTMMTQMLKKRANQAIVRLELDRRPSQELLRLLGESIQVQTHQIYCDSAPLAMGYVYGLENALPEDLRRSLTYQPYTPRWPEDLSRQESMIEQIQRKDRLLFFPFDSIDPFLKLLEEELPMDCTFVFTAQEEVGLRGARTAAWSIAPDYAVAVDVTDVDDTPGSERAGTARLGRGAAVKVMDSSVICHPAVVSALEEAAQTADIPVQKDIMRAGGTDAGAIHTTRLGVLTGGVSIPCRYIHTPVEMADLNDAKHCADLLLAFVCRKLEPIK